MLDIDEKERKKVCPNHSYPIRSKGAKREEGRGGRKGGKGTERQH